MFEQLRGTSYSTAIVLYYIVLYLYIYIALLEVHTNQKRFQCKRPREKSAVLRERKEALGSPVNTVDRLAMSACEPRVNKNVFKQRTHKKNTRYN